MGEVFSFLRLLAAATGGCVLGLLIFNVFHIAVRRLLAKRRRCIRNPLRDPIVGDDFEVYENAGDYVSQLRVADGQGGDQRAIDVPAETCDECGDVFRDFVWFYDEKAIRSEKYRPLCYVCKPLVMSRQILEDRASSMAGTIYRTISPEQPYGLVMDLSVWKTAAGKIGVHFLYSLEFDNLDDFEEKFRGIARDNDEIRRSISLVEMFDPAEIRRKLRKEANKRGIELS